VTNEGPLLLYDGVCALCNGAVTFVQLVKPSHSALLLPEGHIEDWPDLEARMAALNPPTLTTPDAVPTAVCIKITLEHYYAEPIKPEED